jgi:hypothetical protein|eukprot:COSAG01_NODE_2177_length_8218_cov_13.838650_5_plen_58_part_00
MPLLGRPLAAAGWRAALLSDAHGMETRVRTGSPHGYMTLGYRRTAADFDTGRGVGEK